MAMISRSTVHKAVAMTLVAGLALLTGGCSGGGGQSTDSSGKQVVTFWQFDTAQASIQAYEEAITEFETINPDIKIDMQIVPWADQQQKLSTAIAGNSLPDVSMMGNDVVAQYASSGYLKPLDDYLNTWSEEEGIDVVEDFYPGDKEYYTYEGKLYGSPLAAETRMLLINKSLFSEAGLDPDKPPTTWDEMRTAVEKLKEKEIIPWSAPMSNEYITLQTFMSVYLSYGAELFDSEGKCGLETQEFKDALSYYSGIGKDGLSAVDAANMSQSDVGDLFVTGKAAMLIEGPSTIKTIEESNPELAENLLIAKIPAGPEGTFGFLGGWPLVMWHTTDVPDAAAKWIHFVTSPQGALDQIAKTSGILPARISASSTAPWNEMPYSLIAEQLNEAYPYQYPAPASPKMGVIETSAIQSAVQKVATGIADVDKATTELCTEIDQILEN